MKADEMRADEMSERQQQYKDRIVLLETNIDDCTSEELGFCLEKLFSAGVRDAWFTPIYMKKGRPAYALSVICSPDDEETAVRIVFQHTSAIGMRRTEKERIVMDREPVSVETPYGSVKAKKCTYHDLSKTVMEYESVKQLAEKQGVSIGAILRSCSSDRESDRESDRGGRE